MKMKVNAFPIVRGLASYVLPKSIFKRPGSGGTYSGSYCYSVWLRHLHYLMQNKLFSSPDQIGTIAEIGPGDSFGIGMAGIYTGASRYYAMDAISHANVEGNRKINNDLLQSFTTKAKITGTAMTYPVLDSYAFPSYLQYDDAYYQKRHNLIDQALTGKDNTVKMEYIVPWVPETNIQVDDVDLVISQAVMEHVSDLEFAYSSMYKILRKGGVISHQIDFTAHETSDEWNGHFYISEPIWAIMAHGRKYPINRYPVSAHIDCIKKQGFHIECVIPVIQENPFKDKRPSIPGIEFKGDDLITAGVLIQATK